MTPASAERAAAIPEVVHGVGETGRWWVRDRAYLAHHGPYAKDGAAAVAARLNEQGTAMTSATSVPLVPKGRSDYPAVACAGGVAAAAKCGCQGSPVPMRFGGAAGVGCARCGRVERTA